MSRVAFLPGRNNQGADAPRSPGAARLLGQWLAVLAVTVAHAAAAAAPALGPGPRAGRLVRGETFVARLTAIDSDGSIAFEDGQRQWSVGFHDLLAWGAPAKADLAWLVVTADGSLLHARQLAVDDRTARLILSWAAPIALARREVRGIVLAPVADRYERDRQLDRFASAPDQTDRLVLRNDDTVDGKVTRIAGGRIQVNTAAGHLAIGTERVATVTFAPPGNAANDSSARNSRSSDRSRSRETSSGTVNGPSSHEFGYQYPSPLCLPGELCSRQPGVTSLVGFRDGTVLCAGPVTYAEGKLCIEWLPQTPLEITAPEDVVYLQPLGPPVTYLSSLEPESYRHWPYLQRSWPFRRNRSVAGGRLRAAGAIYTKGLGTHSRSEITYRLEKRYRRFEAELALDDHAGSGGSVRLRVELERDGGWAEAYASPILRGTGPPLAVAVDVGRAEAIRLTTEHADRGDQQDHADWLNARLISLQTGEQPGERGASAP